MTLYAGTILTSALLLFGVQPIIAKMILPWFGGSAVVWTTCVLFFQVLLLLGYLYAWALHRFLTPRQQRTAHITLLLLSLAALPIIPDPSWKPVGGEAPITRIVGVLAACIGMPYLMLSTTGPLVQSWFARHFPGASAYRLYALSNLGSMVSLLGYPVLVEPWSGSPAQARGWSFLYGVFVVCCSATAWSFARGPTQAVTTVETSSTPIPVTTRVLWTALPATASALLLSITNHLGQDVASIPFLWVVPLSLYLLTFILCFDAPHWYRRGFFFMAAALSLGTLAFLLWPETPRPGLVWTVVLFNAAFFVLCMVLHGELVRLKPEPAQLTSFYLTISLGGAVGGLFVGVAAPLLFVSFAELQVSIGATALLAAATLVQEPSSPFRGVWKNAWRLIAAAAFVLVGVLHAGNEETYEGYTLLLRNFYGNLRIRDRGDASKRTEVRALTHGRISHGSQRMSTGRTAEPTTYYCPSSGVGLALSHHNGGTPRRVGVIGLGAGTLATYAKPGDTVRFYELNPLVVDVARERFTFLKDCLGSVEMRLGDARLSLEQDAVAPFDVLVVDAFSGDSVPVHLLTEEAFQLYFRHLKPDGVLALHISNTYLNLRPVVLEGAAALGKDARIIKDESHDDENGEDEECFDSTWALLATPGGFLENEAVKTAATPTTRTAGFRRWTDEYSDLFSVLR